jgi:DNA-binding response OmpR family regulator
MKEHLTVLVVDDDRRMVKTICDILRVKGYRAEPAYSGDEAMKKVETTTPDCVLMDIKMPGISGIDAAKKIRELNPDLPVVLMSAYASEEQVAEARKQGAHTVLTKPIDIQVLLSFLSILRKEESILIVDDDPSFCRTLRDILQVSGFRVETEIDPGKIMDLMKTDYKLTVVLDLKLGNADGIEILRDIRALYPQKPVILVTGYREEMMASISKGLQIGAYTCLYKPLEVDELVRIIGIIRKEKLRGALGEPP